MLRSSAVLFFSLQLLWCLLGYTADNPAATGAVITLPSKAANWFIDPIINLKTDQVSTIEIQLPSRNGSVAKWHGLRPVFTYGNPDDYACYEWFTKDDAGVWHSGDPSKRGKDALAGNGALPVQKIIPAETAKACLSQDGRYWFPWMEIDNTEVNMAQNTFIMRYQFQQPAATIAMRLPFTDNYLQQYLTRLQAGKYPGVSVDQLGLTPQKRKLQVIRLEDPTATKPDDNQMTVLVYAREQSTEPASSWAICGIVASLINAPATSPFRKGITWLLIPIMDPDGSANNQTNHLTGKFMGHPDAPDFPPEILAYARYMIDYIDKGRSIDLAVTLQNPEANETPNIFNPFFDHRYEPAIIDINRRLFDTLAKQGYSVATPEANWGKGVVTNRLYGWCCEHFSTFPLAYEVNDRFPTNPLSLQRLQGIGGAMTGTFTEWCHSEAGQQWHIRVKQCLKRRAQDREGYFKEMGYAPDKRTPFDILYGGY